MEWRRFQGQQHLVELDGQFLSYIDQGEGNPVVLLHGLPTWGFVWDQVIPHLTASRRVLVPDLPGFGYSAKGDSFDRSIAAQTGVVRAWLQRLGIEKPDIVGHHIGGGVALRLAVLHPETVGRLALIDTVSYDSWPAQTMLQFADPEASRRLSVESLLELVRATVKKGFDSSPPDEVLDGLLAPYRTEVGALSLIRDFAALNTNLTTELTPRLSQITAPTLVIWGENDAFQPVKYGERLAMDIPECRLVRIPNAGHFVMYDQPAEVIAQLRAFLPA